MTRIHQSRHALLVMAALGTAGMVLGGGDWLGIDFGSAGGALLYAALWAFVIQLARHAHDVFPETWSLAEKQAWVALVFLVLFSFHMLKLLDALPDLGPEADRMRNSATRPLSASVGMLTVAWIVVSSMLRKQDAGTWGATNATCASPTRLRASPTALRARSFSRS